MCMRGPVHEVRSTFKVDSSKAASYRCLLKARDGSLAPLALCLLLQLLSTCSRHTCSSVDDMPVPTDEQGPTVFK